MYPVPVKISRNFTPAAREAALATKRAKMNEPDDFGHPEVYVARVGARSFTWELRRFGGLVLHRGTEAFDTQDLAAVAGRNALATLCATPGLPTFKRQNLIRRSAAQDNEASR